jgi:hypothetical protein
MWSLYKDDVQRKIMAKYKAKAAQPAAAGR